MFSPGDKLQHYSQFVPNFTKFKNCGLCRIVVGESLLATCCMDINRLFSFVLNLFLATAEGIG